MPQSADKVKDHIDLFKEPEYREMFEAKKQAFECPHPDDKVKETADWTKSWDYREKNLAREALSVNPNKACQPLGALFAGVGFERSLPFIHGSQGCVAYFRSHLSRHFKEPTSAVSSSMTEDAAVFGGFASIKEGLGNAYQLYKPSMIALSTTCMAEVIGDDLNSFIIQSKDAGQLPQDVDVPFAHTPSFVGSHITGYDNMMKGILEWFWQDTEQKTGDGINIIPGFDGYAVGNNREIKRYLDMMGVNYTLLSDVSDVFDTPSDGEFRMYDGGTRIQEAKDSVNAKATLSLQAGCSTKTLQLCKDKGHEVAAFNYPMGVSATDEFLMKVSEITGKAIPEAITKERGRLVDAMADSQAWLHGRKMAIYGDPDFCIGMARFLMELGVEPVHVLSTNAPKKWAKEMRAVLDESPFGKDAQVWQGKDLWHLHSLLATEPADFLIGNTYGKYLERDLGIPLIRLTFPIFDRHHHHRFPVWGYQGGLRVLTTLLDKIFDRMDAATNIAGVTDISYDLTR